MTKVFWMLLALLMCMSLVPALAEEDLFASAQIAPILSGASCDLNGDGIDERITYEISNDLDAVPYAKLIVNDQELLIEGCYMDEQLYLLDMEPEAQISRLSLYPDELNYLLVYDYGPSDDPCTYFIYMAEDGTLQSAGEIYADPHYIAIENGILTANVRGSLLYTWWHPADFAIAHGFQENLPARRIAPLPRAFYPMSLVVKAKRDIPLYKAIGSAEVSCTLQSGDTAILCGSDDVEWIYITLEDGFTGGWLQVDGEYGTSCLIDGVSVFGSDLFDGLLFAD